MNFDEALRELSDITVKLADLDPADPTFDEVTQRREELRQFMRALDVDAARPLSELEQELAALETRLEAAEKELVSRTKTRFVGAERTVGGGVEPKEINDMIDKANRREELEARADHLRRVIAAKRQQ